MPRIFIVRSLLWVGEWVYRLNAIDLIVLVFRPTAYMDSLGSKVFQHKLIW
jgi:hypothetical protein